MTKLQKLIDKVKSYPDGICTIGMLEKEGYTRKQILTYCRKTLHLSKEDKGSDVIKYVDKPEIPYKYYELIIEDKDIENIEELLFMFIYMRNYIPSQDVLQNYCEKNGYYFNFDWSNRNNYQSAKKKIVRIMKECRLLDS